jgi:hypothetical protein
MPDFPTRIVSPQASKAVLDFIRHECPWAVDWVFWYRQIINLDAARRVFTAAAATSQVLTLNSLFPRNVFPRNVDLREGAKVRRIENPTGTGISDFDILVGGVFDAGTDADGLLTITDIFGEGEGYSETVGAANYARRYESEFSPTVTLQATGANLTALEAGSFEVLIPWSPLRSYD